MNRFLAWRVWSFVGMVGMIGLVGGLAGCGSDEEADSTTATTRAAAGGDATRRHSLAVVQPNLARWSAVKTLPLVPVSATNLPDGRILMWSAEEKFSFGGTGRTYSLTFDPLSQAVSERLVSETGHDMFCTGTTNLADGRLLVNGGLDSAKTSIFDPTSGVWTTGALMNIPRGYQANTLLQDGSVLTLGGSWSGGVGNKHGEVWSQASGWRRLSGVPIDSFLSPDPSRAFGGDSHFWLIPAGNGRVFHAGPGVNMHWIDTSGTGSVTPAGVRGDDQFSVSGSTVMYDSGKILKTGGGPGYDSVQSNSNSYVIDLNGGVNVRKLAPMAYRRAFHNSVVLPNGQVVIIGGQTYAVGFNDDNAVLAPELWDPDTETFTTLPAMAVPRNYHSVALLLPDGRVMSAGGGLCGAGCAANHPDLQILSPPYLFNADGTTAVRPAITAAPATVGHGQTIEVTTDSAITSFALVRMSSTTHTVNNDQRRLVPVFRSTGTNRYAVDIPSNPGLALPGHWMLFALNANGTPSVARALRLTLDGDPTLAPVADQATTVAGPVSFVPAVTLPAGTVATWSATGLPDGTTIDATTGRISGTPSAVGTFRVSVFVTAGSRKVSTDFMWQVSMGAGSGSGLKGEYFANATLGGVPVRSVVEAVDFNWGDGSPGAGVPADNFSVRWSGTIEAPVTGVYEFQTESDDGVRLTVNGVRLIDNWTDHPPAVDVSAQTLQLTAGQRYAVTMEYYERGGGAVARLRWKTPGTTAAVVVPASRLLASATDGPGADTSSGLKGEYFTNTTLGGTPVRSAVEAVDFNWGNGSPGAGVPTDNFSVRWSGTIEAPVTGGYEFQTESDDGVRLTVNGVRLIDNWTDHGPAVDVSAQTLQLIAGQRYAVTMEYYERGGGAVARLRWKIPGTTAAVAVPASRLQPPGSTSTGTLPTLQSVIVAPIAVGGTVSWTVTPSAAGTYTYQWDFGDGSPVTAWSSSPSASHAYAAAGVYSVTATLRTTDGRTTTRSFWQVVQGTTGQGGRSSSPVLIENRTGATPRLWSVNPDHGSVSVFDLAMNTRVAVIPVGDHPRTLALGPDGRVWVANQDSASLSIVSPTTLAVVQTVLLPRASQPYGVVVGTDGTALVTLEAVGRVVKVSAAGVVGNSVDVGPNVRHLALNAAGNRLLVTRFITPALPGEGTAAVQTSVGGVARGGELLVLDPVTLVRQNTVVLATSERPDTTIGGRGVPNYLGAPVIAPDGRSAWVPSKQDNIQRGTLRDGLNLTFENTVRAVSSVIDLGTLTEATTARIDHDNSGVASAAAFHPTGAFLFVALEASRHVAVVDPVGRRELFRFDVGRAPQGVAVSADGFTLYVHHFMDRTIGVYDLRPLLQRGEASVLPTATLEATASEVLPAAVLRGKQLFYDARDPRLARDGYMSCAACHNEGGHDGRTWDFTGLGEGLRNTISLRGRAGAQGRLHWSANFDEVQDFEGQIRGLQQGTGLMTDAQFTTGTRSQPLGDAKAGVSADLDALAAYVGSLNTFAPTPYRQPDGTLTVEAVAGRQVFTAKNCAQCHAGTAFTSSSLTGSLMNIGTLKPSSGQRLGAALAGIDAPTLRDVWSTGPYLHDGSVATLGAAVSAHSGVSLTGTELSSVVAYLQQIGREETTAPTPIATTAVSPLFGGPGGTAFTDPVASGQRLTGVTVNAGWWLDGLQALATPANLAWHGGTGGARTTFTLAAGESLVRIYGQIGDGRFVSKISFVTSTGRTFGPYGLSQGFSSLTSFDFTVPAGQRVLGFTGRSSGYLDAIGVVYGP